jgi:hypothetical protein
MAAKTTLILAISLLLIAVDSSAQGTFSSGSNGSDGALNLTGQTGTVWFYPANYPGNQHAFGIFNWTTITIPAGVTLKLSGFITDMPLYFLASGNVDVEGTIDLSGANGADNTTDVTKRVPTAPGPGGYTGGLGGIYNSSTFPDWPGSGQGGGAPGAYGIVATSGIFSGTQYLTVLVGGSGGGGGITLSAVDGYGPGGGAGGGALLIASSTEITVNGTIDADGGAPGSHTSSYWGGCGSGGAIRLMSNSLIGSGTVTSWGAGGDWQVCADSHAQPGIVRLEAYTNTFKGTVNAGEALSTPYKLILPTTGQSTIQVTSINGVAINANPFKFPDIEINTTSPVPVVVTASQIPIGTVPTITLFTTTGDQMVSCTGGLQGTIASSSCTVNVTFPGAGTWGLAKTTWK